MNFPALPERIFSEKTQKTYLMVRADQLRFGPGSAAQIAAVCQQTEVYKLFAEIFRGRPYAEADAKTFLALVQAGWKHETNFHWMICLDDEIVGTVGIKSTDGEIGYWQSSLHPGVISHAVRRLCDLARAAALPSLWAYVRRDNLASLRVLAKSGFSPDEVLTGELEDSVGYRRVLGS